MMRALELLAPAKNLECGIAAIDHGADAVYIGAPRFGARASAGNSLEDIKQLCDYAHQFGAKVHVTVNTIIYDDELEDTIKMIQQLDQIGVDALLLQDMGVLAEVRANNVWRRQLHSSTQCDVRTPEKAFWLSTVGFNRIVLARELSLDEIRAIHDQVPDKELEVFVHGALCVSYSGVCYASEKCFGRSANRGECAQFCRMKFDLVDSDGNEIEHQRHLLSLKDLCQIDHLKELADAGASSFKIEGRLKDIDYVKNVVSAYSKKLDEIVMAEPRKYYRASWGHKDYFFTPNLKKTFNRGFTNYFLKGRQPDIASFDTPKAIGEYVGKVKEIRGKLSFNVATVASFMNGDGLCFINDEHELEGFRVNRVEGNRLYPFRMPENLRPGMALYRNNDRAFEAILSRKSAERKVYIVIALEPVTGDTAEGQPSGIKVVGNLMVNVDIGGGTMIKLAEFFKEMPLEKAKRNQRENMILQMSKLGDTVYEAFSVDLLQGMDTYFVPNSVLTAIRRELVETLDDKKQKYLFDNALMNGVNRTLFGNGYGLSEPGELKLEPSELEWQPEYAKWRYLYNIANYSAVDFYEMRGLENVKPAFELGGSAPAIWSSKSKEQYDQDFKAYLDWRKKGNVSYPKNRQGEALIMQCRHCIRYSLGYCVRRGGEKPTWREPLYLRLGDGRRFRLEFACGACQMNVYSED